MMVLFIFLIHARQELLLPQELGFANYVVFDKDEIFVLDAVSDGLFCLDASGGMLAKHKKMGYGPGEVSEYSNFTVRGNRVYLLDNQQRKMITLDRDLQYVNQAFFPSGGACSGFDASHDAFYFYYYDPSTNMVVHKFDPEMKKLHSFCPTFKEGEEIPKKDSQRYHYSFSNGHVRIFNELLYVMHSFRYRVDIFDLNGKLLKTHPIPGVQASDFFNEQKRTFDVMARGLRLDENGNMYLSLGNRYPNAEKGIPKPKLLMLNPNTGQWQERPHPSLWYFPARDQRFVRSLEREDGRVLLRFEPNPFLN